MIWKTTARHTFDRSAVETHYVQANTGIEAASLSMTLLDAPEGSRRESTAEPYEIATPAIAFVEWLLHRLYGDERGWLKLDRAWQPVAIPEIVRELHYQGILPASPVAATWEADPRLKELPSRTSRLA